MTQNERAPSTYGEGTVAVGALLWGEGFLAPGGPQSVREIVAGLDLAGKRLLDIGCGNGGAAVVLAREFGAAVTGIDIEPGLIDQARALTAREGLQDRVEMICVDPGPLPFADAGFDVVFGKDSWLLIEDKPAFFDEVSRVLRPGGGLAASEWMGDGAAPSADMKHYFALRGLTYRLEPAATYKSLLHDAGFVDVEVTEAPPAYARTARSELEGLRGPLRDQLVALLGAVEYEGFVKRWEAMTVVLEKGELRGGHLHAGKPG